MTARCWGAIAPSYERYGLEASAAAAEAARQRGVEIVASRIRDLPSIPLQFDVISAVDVESPLGFLTMLADRLKPGGSLIILTGTLDAPAWRFVGGLYWYCSYPEHISFITQDWAQQAGARQGLTLTEARRFACGEPDARRLGRARRRFYRKVLVARWREKLRLWWQSASAQPAPLRSQGYPKPVRGPHDRVPEEGSGSGTGIAASSPAAFEPTIARRVQRLVSAHAPHGTPIAPLCRSACL